MKTAYELKLNSLGTTGKEQNSQDTATIPTVKSPIHHTIACNCIMLQLARVVKIYYFSFVSTGDHRNIQLKMTQ